MRFILTLLFSYGLLNVEAQYQYHYHYENDFQTNPEKTKIIMVAEELIKEAHLKIRQVADIRDDHSTEKAFEIGLVMGHIREKYRRMLETYREFRDKKSGRSLFVPASMWELSPIHYIIAMEQVHALETDIDKLIHSLERIDSEDFNPDPRYIETTTLRRRPVRPRAMEMERNIKENFREEEETLKRRYREEQLLRRVGASGRHTKRPRFQQQWPVEETWRLGPYGDGAKYY